MLGRRVLGEREIVLPNDPAVDLEASNLDAYRDSFFDIQHLKIRDGATPTRWKICPLTVRQRRRLADEDTYARRELIVRCGLVWITDYALQDESGNAMSIQQPDRQERTGLGVAASEQWLESMHLHQDDLLLLSLGILAISEARPLS